jgi:two-component system, OmpR family, phosphate regulon response regulator PhoB
MSENFVPSVLLVEPDESLLTILSYNLERYGFIVNTAKDADAAVKMAERIQPDIAIIDQDISGSLSGIEICTIIRTKAATKNTPLILITSDSNNLDAIKGIENGINDYIIKPFAPSELVARIKTIFRKTRPISSSKVLIYKDLQMNIGSYKVTRGSRNIHLGPTEFKILQCLMELPTKILSREHIMNHVWGYNSQVEPRTIDVHINRLRMALKNDNDDLPLIRTIRSAGYCLGE